MEHKFNQFLLDETLKAVRLGYYRKNMKKHYLPHNNPVDLGKAIVLLPEITCETQEKPLVIPNNYNHCKVSCVDTDSLSMAQTMLKDKCADSSVPLVLNFANPTNPGGGVRRGAKAQEEDLCRKSTLLFSLESTEAIPYYRYNMECSTGVGTDAIILSPNVDVIRNNKAEFDDAYAIAVITCAAPFMPLDGISKDEYRRLMIKRIYALLSCAVRYGYSDLVLGAWGCGAFGNDASDVASCFNEALRTFELMGYKTSQLFHRIGFAVMVSSGIATDEYSFEVFRKQFGDFQW